MKLDVGDPLRPISEVGTGRAKTDPKMVALAEVIEMLNQLFGGDMFAQHQQQSWIESAMRALLPDPSLVQQAKATTLQQFTESEDFENAVRSTVMENQQAFDKISEIVATNASPIEHQRRHSPWANRQPVRTSLAHSRHNGG